MPFLRHLYPLALLLGLSQVVTTGCKRCRPRQAKPESGAIEVSFASGKESTVTLRLALRATYPERARPLGKVRGRTHQGLLLAYPRSRALGVDLTTAEVAVDVILLDKDLKVVRVATGQSAAAGRRIGTAPKLHRYAVVLPGGAAKKHRLRKGIQARFSLPARARPGKTLTPVDLHPPGRARVTVRAELALSNEERLMGLMFRRYLAPRGGMLFRFERPRVLYFYMRNTFVSLDMIFITEDRVVSGVVHRTKPLSETNVGVGPVQNRYVLEVPAGFARRHGIVRGTRVSFAIP